MQQFRKYLTRLEKELEEYHSNCEGLASKNDGPLGTFYRRKAASVYDSLVMVGRIKAEYDAQINGNRPTWKDRIRKFFSF